MKYNLKLYRLFAALAAGFLAGCSTSDNVPLPEGKTLRITALCGDELDVTRANGQYWDSGDVIGVFSSCSNGTKQGNVPYILNSTGSTQSGVFKFNGNTPTNEIKLSSGSTYDLYAYYPCQGTEGAENISADIDLSDQTRVPELLYATVSDHPGLNPFVSLFFYHALTKLRIVISSAELDLGNAGLYISGIYTQGNMTANCNSPMTVVKSGTTVTNMNITNMYVPGSDKKSGNNVIERTYEVTLPPQDNVTISIKADNLEYIGYDEHCSGEYRISSLSLNANGINTINLTVNRGGKITLNSATIQDWTQVSQPIKVEPK